MTLRPSLRAAATLEARFGFATLFRALDEGSFTVISEIIAATASHRHDATAFLSAISERPFSDFFDAAQAPLGQLVVMFVPAADTDQHSSTGKAIPYRDLYRQLFRVATGEFGWSPETAWNATPTEINEAYIGKLGTGDKQTDPEQAARNEAAGLDPEFDRAGLRALKAKIAR